MEPEPTASKYLPDRQQVQGCPTGSRCRVAWHAPHWRLACSGCRRAGSLPGGAAGVRHRGRQRAPRPPAAAAQFAYCPAMRALLPCRWSPCTHCPRTAVARCSAPTPCAPPTTPTCWTGAHLPAAIACVDPPATIAAVLRWGGRVPRCLPALSAALLPCFSCWRLAGTAARSSSKRRRRPRPCATRSLVGRGPLSCQTGSSQGAGQGGGHGHCCGGVQTGGGSALAPQSSIHWSQQPPDPSARAAAAAAPGLNTSLKNW